MLPTYYSSSFALQIKILHWLKIRCYSWQKKKYVTFIYSKAAEFSSFYLLLLKTFVWKLDAFQVQTTNSNMPNTLLGILRSKLRCTLGCGSGENSDIFILTCTQFPQFSMVPMYIDKRLALYPNRFKTFNVYFNKSV